MELQTRINLQKETEADSELSIVKQAVPKNWNEVPKEIINKFGKSRESISIVEGSLMFNDRVIIPAAMRKQILKTLHHGHPGIRRMKQLSREFVY